MKPRLGEVTKDDLKVQLNDYHITVAEVLGGMSEDMTDQQNRISDLELRVSALELELRESRTTNMRLLREILLISEKVGGKVE